MEKTGFKHTDLSDCQLIELALKDDQGAFSMLLSRYREALTAHIMKYVRVQADAEDICQRSFEKAFMEIGSYNPSYAFSTWLFTIAQNLSIDHLRKSRSAAGQVPLESPAVMSLTSLSTPEEEFMEDQAVSELLICIEKLPDLYREVAKCRFVRDYAYEDIARELSLPIGTVKTRINRARKMLMTMAGICSEDEND